MSRRPSRAPSDPAALDAAVAAASFRHSRIVDHWPDAHQRPIHELPAVAPPEALIAALSDELDHYRKLLDAERARRQPLDDRAARMVALAHQVIEAAAATPVPTLHDAMAQLDLFETTEGSAA